ncbi:hypothetical protein, partial [Mycobacterium avium]
MDPQFRGAGPDRAGRTPGRAAAQRRPRLVAGAGAPGDRPGRAQPPDHRDRRHR